MLDKRSIFYHADCLFMLVFFPYAFGYPVSPAFHSETLENRSRKEELYA